MCQLIGGVVEGTVGAAGAVLWARAALELRKTCSAMAHLPLRWRSSGSSSRSSRVSTSTLLTLEWIVDDGAYDAYVPGVKGGSPAVQTAEETVGLVRGRGRRRLGKESLGSTNKSGPPREVNIRGKSVGRWGVIGEYSKEFPLVGSPRKNIFDAKSAKKGKVDSPMIARPKITPSLRSYYKNLPLGTSDDCTRFMELEEGEGLQSSVIKTMEKVGTEVRVEEMAVRDKSENKKDRCPVLSVNSESQEEQSGESPPGPMVNKSHAPGISQILRMEYGEGTAMLSPMEEMITKLVEEIKKGFSVSEANQASIKEVSEIL
ncbi:hypothetical protein NDU88_006849 [Pleurodeles waltl]|uniref:Uncharacterized protein n=1 Tax=Pleurodeles waltl TaxID=8319 RepID=A0AAV7X2Q0_PLEWA|nr:hypothetical protein NDU88_006849 [Pleurodeles waltl]